MFARPGGKSSLRGGNLGHVSRIANKILEMVSRGSGILLQATENNESWKEWVASGLRDRNLVRSLGFFDGGIC